MRDNGRMGRERVDCPYSCGEVTFERAGGSRGDRAVYSEIGSCRGRLSENCSYPKPKRGELLATVGPEVSRSILGKTIDSTSDSPPASNLESGYFWWEMPVNFSNACLLDSFFANSASAPRPLGSNLSRRLVITLDGCDVESQSGEIGDDGKLEVRDEEAVREVGRPSLRFGNEMELDRVCECFRLRAVVAVDDEDEGSNGEGSCGDGVGLSRTDWSS